MAFFHTRPFSACDQRGRIARGVHPSLMNDGHVAAQVADVGDDVRGENDDDVLADGAEQIVEAHALFGVEAGGGLVDDDEPRIAQQRLRDAEALLHAAGIAAQRLVAMVPQVGLPQQGVDHIAPLLGVLDALQRCEVRQQRFGRDLRIQPELLRQIAEQLADFVFLPQHVDAVEARGAAVGLLQRGQRAHERGLAGAVGAEQSEHALGNGQRDVLQRLRPVGIALGEVIDL